MSNQFLILWIILCIMIIVLFAIIVLPWIGIALGAFFESAPYAPEIKYGEFPFSLTYMIDDEVFTIEDTIICEYDGVGWNEGIGKFRKWKARLKSGKTRITLLKNDNAEIYYFPVKKEDSRLPGIFMGDIEFYSGGVGNTFPDAWYTTNFDDKTINDYIISADDMKEKYSLKLINWECDPPIENKFE